MKMDGLRPDSNELETLCMRVEFENQTNPLPTFGILELYILSVIRKLVFRVDLECTNDSFLPVQKLVQYLKEDVCLSCSISHVELGVNH